MSISVPGPLNTGKAILVLSIWIVLLIGSGLIWDLAGKQWTPGNRSDQCEALNYSDPIAKTGKILEIQNTWSNAGYLLAGLLILFCTRRLAGWILGVQLCVLAVLSNPATFCTTSLSH